MTKTKTAPSNRKPLKLLDAPAELPPAGFDSLEYYIKPSLEDFDLAAFRAYFRDRLTGLPAALQRSPAKSITVAVAPRDSKAGLFHIFFRSTEKSNGIDFKVDYRTGPRKHERDEKEPYAEEFMQWFGQFFKNGTAHAHLHEE